MLTGTFTFAGAHVRRLLAASKEATQRNPAWGQEQPVPAGLLLVKDEGLYLMSNGRHHILGGPLADPICWADGYGPDDGWIGGDDFVEFIDARDLDKLPPEGDLVIKLTKATIAFSSRPAASSRSA